jgi:hypothetical protein
MQIQCIYSILNLGKESDMIITRSNRSNLKFLRVLEQQHCNIPGNSNKLELPQGTQTQILRVATFAWKMSPKAADVNKKDSAGSNVEK